MTSRPAQAAALLGLAALPLLGLPAAPAVAAACGGTSGVTVVVDFSAFGRGVVTACAPGDPESGLDALTRAGFQPYVQPNGFVCRIDGLPDAQQEACVRTPPADAYWAYLHGRDGAWQYSSQGAGSYDPEPGDTEGWAFGDDARPSVPPPTPARKTPTATATSSAKPAPGVPAGTTSAAGSGATTGPALAATTARPAPGTSSRPSPSRSGPMASGQPSAVASPASTAPPPTTPAAQPDRALGPDDGGSGLPALLGGVVVLALLGSAFGTALSRRRAGDG